VASNGAISVKSHINGTAKTLLDNGLTLNPPGGSVSGTKCMGAGCHSITLPTFGSWESYCPTHNGDATINADTTYAAGGCWRDITISNNKTLTLSDTEQPYYIRKITQSGNFAKFAFGAIPSDKKVTLYIGEFTGDHLNGNQFLNPNNAPHQAVVNYLGSNKLYLNGTAAFNAFIVAPSAQVEVNGNFIFYGSIKATALDIRGAARPYADEAAVSTPVLSDARFSLKKASQRYR
jgi:hypothetical protein